MESTRTVSLSEKAYLAYERLAAKAGLSVEEYLDRVAVQSDEFVMTPELRKKLEEAIAEADAGNLIDFSVVQEQLSQYRAQWRESNGKSSR